MKNKEKQNKPTILEQSITDNTAKLLLKIDPVITYFDGHFNNYPILAGVAQIDWAIYYGKKLFVINGMFSGMEVIKFQQPILPNMTILLTLTWDAQKQKLYFSYASEEDNNHASGRIKLESHL